MALVGNWRVWVAAGYVQLAERLRSCSPAASGLGCCGVGGVREDDLSDVQCLVGPIWNGGAPSVSATVTVPQRPYLVPAAPSSVSVSRVSDTQATVAFAVASSGSAPVQSIGIERRSLRDPVWRNLVWLDRSTSG